MAPWLRPRRWHSLLLRAFVITAEINAFSPSVRVCVFACSFVYLLPSANERRELSPKRTSQFRARGNRALLTGGFGGGRASCVKLSSIQLVADLLGFPFKRSDPIFGNASEIVCLCEFILYASSLKLAVSKRKEGRTSNQ